ncbi:MAG: type I glyceraldehyde-3-phosphate dehydrogenase [Candidatus Woesearchaeota archaeon]
MFRVAINGFGRIGRMVFRAGFNDPEIEFVAVNDLASTENLAYLLKYDSVHGRFPGEVSYDNDNIYVNGKRIRVYSQKEPSNLPWADLKIDVVVESTGIFRTKESASKHISAGAKKVLLSAPGKDIDLTIVKGVNEHEYDGSLHHVVSNASCTTNNIAPIIKVLNDNYGVRQGYFVTIHSYTPDQHLLDSPHSDFRRGRHAALSIIPTTTGAAKSVGETIPSLKGKLDGHAVRVPTPNGSYTDINVILDKEVSADEINSLFKSVANYHLKSVLEYSDEHLVSADIIGNPHSAIFDSRMTKSMGSFVKVMAWYDNEAGYSYRMIDLIKVIMQ